ncbi:uncharacterized protein Eint_051080 [Encephalitozoon intestinalis ATCC 50506]|uniref:Uncharacterized protein n=1 Tax=Encephalitozoon intestinalis (strain ATCC 50506) TaxID=876142 RepID=E0S6W9_ENCIT|nr:uncharacterized protein Eint_051080 [Encephalitozoon intestinalis ATCC 50506]ADM11555.1 hypothetical protein Eint_051080 [Encephalitozoon intestinalis ATCC 50506]UTX45269.1 hypothetical protein GPK93_05g08150 [Encephalitozoon intestinalis]
MQRLPLLGVLVFAVRGLHAKYISHLYDVYINENYVNPLKELNPPSDENKMISQGEYLHRVYFGMCVPAYKRIGMQITKERSEYIVMVLNFLYEFCSTRQYELAAVTATVLHNTSYLRIFEGPGRNPYRPRGIFQVYSDVNYINLQKVSFFYHDYVENPDRASVLNIHVLVDMVCFWLDMTFNKKKKIDLLDVLEVTNPVEWRVLRDKWNYMASEVKKAEEKLKSREELYQKLLSIIYINYYRD